MKRISRNELFMGIANLVAKRSTCGRKAVGVVAVSDKRVIAMGYNGVPAGQPHCSLISQNNFSVKGVEPCDADSPCKRAIHAEANLIAFCAKKGISLGGSTLYVTTAPCRKCSELIVQAGVTSVIFMDTYRESDGLDLLTTSNVDVLSFTPAYENSISL